MSEGYKQASEITRNLIIAFVGGIVVGCAIGWGARSTISGTPTAPPELSVAAQTPPEAPPAPPAPPEVASPEVEPVVEPVVNATPPTSMASFAPDVDGLWPAGHLWVGIQGTRADVETQEWLNEFKPGGVVLGPENVIDPLQLGALVLQIKQAVGLGTTINDPPFIVYDDPDNALPHILVDAVAGEGSISADTAAAQAVEALKQGVGVFLGPSLDLYIPGVSEPEVQRTSLGEDVDLVSAIGLGYADMLLNAGIVPVAKHFPGAGLVSKDADGTWRIPVGQMDDLAMAMQPFKAAINSDIPGILVGLMAVPGIDTERPNRPGALSPRLLQLLVRDDWDYGGVLIADDITRHPMTRDLPREEIALKALFSGCDVVILRDATRADLRKICDTFVTLSSRSEFPATQMEESKQRLIAWRGRLGKPLARPVAPLVADTPTPDPATPAEAPAETAPTTEADVAPTPEPETTETAAEPETPAEPTVPEADVAPTTPEVLPETPVVAESTDTPVPPEVTVEPVVIEHTIVKGDSLTVLARKHHVSVSDIRTWNNMDSDVIKIGQVLKLHVAADSAAPPSPTPEAPAPETATPDAAAPSMDPSTPAPEADDTAPKVEEPSKAPEPAPDPVAESPEPVEQPETPPVDMATPAAAATEEKPAAEPAPAVAPAVSSQPPGTDRREHIVAAGETLGLVAATYGVSVADIQSWNGLDPEETIITAGAALVVYLPTAESTPGTPPPATPVDTPADGAASAMPVAEKPAYVAPAPGTYDEHVVVSGDNLRRIAQRYGTTQQVIIEMNNITDPNLVKLGAKLKVPKQPAGVAPPPPADATP